MKKQTCCPSSLSALFTLLPSTPFIPPSPLVLCWSERLEEQQAFPVCSGITVCDFSLTSQAALWHVGVLSVVAESHSATAEWRRTRLSLRHYVYLSSVALSHLPVEDIDWHMSGKFIRRTCPLWLWKELRKTAFEHVYQQPEMSCFSLTRLME